VFGFPPGVSASDWFASAEITSRMLRTLGRIGPGGVIITDLYERDYYVTHSRALNPASGAHCIVYGYHDLVRDLANYTEAWGDRAWEELVPAVDCSTWDCLDQWAEDIAATGFVVPRLRHRLHCCGFDLSSSPHYYDRYGVPGDHASTRTRVLSETYADRSNPTIALTTKVPIGEAAGSLSLIRISDDGCHVTGWPARLSSQFLATHHARRAREAVDAYLRRRNA
jgi:hypothetical protein